MLDHILDNANYLAITLAFVSLLGGGFISWIVTFVYFKKGQSRKLLCYATSSASYLGYNQGDFHDLSVRYGDKQLANPFRYTLYVWNCGNVTINRADISSIDPLAFGRNDLEVLETNPIWSTRDSTNPKLLIDTTKKKIVFEFDFLDPNDGFAVQFLADKSNSDAWWQTNLQCYGTIKGLMRSPYQVATKFKKTRWRSFFIGLAVFLFFGFCAIAMAFDVWAAGFSYAGFVRALAAAIFSFLAFFTAMITLEDQTNSSAEVIPALLRKSSEIPPEDDPVPPRVLAHLGQRP